MRYRHLSILILWIIPATGFSQSLELGRSFVDTLSSQTFWGRGYTKDGMHRAAVFLEGKFREYGLQPLSKKDYFQEYSYPVNTFPGKMSVQLNGLDLIPGKDFIISAESSGAVASGELEQADSVTFIDRMNKVIVALRPKLTMDVSERAEAYTLVLLKEGALNKDPFKYKIAVENKEVKKFEARNICGMVKGNAVPDSFIFITAHYDHLGGLGADVFFPGANDNASGVSLLMNLAQYYAKHPQRYSIGFLLFSGEEAGLKGSEYFTEHPTVDLKKIRFLTNTDLAGTGVDGITVVNASEFPAEFEMLKEVNSEKQLLKAINSRGKAANSDHYFFTEKGVPSFFFYTLGGISAYHDIFDRSETLPMNEHEDLFKLMLGFNRKLMGMNSLE
ncbi:MAG TPA: M28 family peptidase [Bacteroidia bacterium]|nr:M28 family peptidase [Bacteroidia bacterium]HNP99041.1 M28 family peptidase [Bacteroidia bacterium]